jgi:hypothetical protein
MKEDQKEIMRNLKGLVDKIKTNRNVMTLSQKVAKCEKIHQNCKEAREVATSPIPLS